MSKKSILTFFTSISSVAIATTLTVFTILSATGNIKINAEIPSYNCVFYNDDNTFLYSVRVKRNGYATYNGNLPTKKSDKVYDYKFVEWDKSLTNIRDHTNFYAVYEAKTRDYLVSFVNYDGTTLYADYVQAGDEPTYFGVAPTKPATHTKEYQFVGWDKPFTPIFEDTSFKAVYEEVDVKYDVYFINYDNYLLAEDSVAYNGTAIYRGDVPVRPNEDNITYTFKGWDRPLSGIVDTTYIYAEYHEEVANYKVTYLNYDSSVLYEERVLHGHSAVYDGKTPVKPNSTTYKYTFIGWDTDLNNVTSDITTYALFSESKITFDIEFRNYDMSVLAITSVEIGATAEYLGPIPERPADAQYTYHFIGWDRKLTEIKDSFFTIALFESQLHQYTVTFKNGDIELQTVVVDAGSDVVYSGSPPTKPDDEFYSYEFIGWNDPLTNILADKVVHAQFEATPLIKLGGEDEDDAGDDGDGFGTGEDGQGGKIEVPPMRPGHGNDLSLQVEYKNWNNEQITDDLVLKGNDAYYRENKETPTRPADNKYSYTFTSFDKKLTNVQKAFTTYAQYTAFDGLVDKYIVTFRDDENIGDGRLLYEAVVDYGEMPEYFTTVPPVPKKAKYRNAMFMGWSAKLVPATQSYTVYAVYTGASVTKAEEDENTIVDEPIEDDETAMFEYYSQYSGELYFREKSYSGLANNVWDEPATYDLHSDEELSPLYFTSNKLENAGYLSNEVNLSYYAPQKYSLVPTYNSGQYATTPNSDAYASQFYDVNQQVDFNMNVPYTFISYKLDESSADLLRNVPFTKDIYAAHELNYQAYARANYLGLNSNQLAFLETFITTHNLKAATITDIVETTEFVQSYATYNKNFDKYPEGDNIVHFLESSKEGICQHFASALTVIFRALDVPARYVTGYYTTAAGNGNTTIVQAKQKHAWTEIYLNKIGWVAVDATPGDGTGDGGIDEPQLNVNPFGPFDPTTPNPILIHIAPNEDSKAFDNKQMTITGSFTGDLDDGDVLVYNIQRAASEIGLYTTRAYPRIYNQNGVDVSKKYAGRVDIITYQYLILRRELTIKTGSAVKDRDGEPLINHELEIIGNLPEGFEIVVDITGSQQNPGSSLNYIDAASFMIIDSTGHDVTKNFIISWELGILEVK